MVGDIIAARFPLADQPRFKQRPCLVISEADALGDFMVMKITSRQLDLPGRMRIAAEDFQLGGLPATSAVVPGDSAKINVRSVMRYFGRLKLSSLNPILKQRISSATRQFSAVFHTANRPGDDPMRLEAESRSQSASEQYPPVPYAGRVFTEDEVEAAVSSTLDFWLTLGSEGAAFEKELAEFLGVRHTVLVNSGSSANLVAFSALTSHKLPDHKRIRPGDEVITCAAGFPTTVAPILQNGCVPVFLDNDPTTGNARFESLEAAYFPGKTKAVMMAHTLGNPFDLAAVCAFCHEHDLWLIEDNCDALGCTYTLPVELARSIGLDHLIKIADSGKHPLIRYEEPKTKNQELFLTAPTGTFGDLSTQSFYPPHHLTMGEGGAVNVIRRPQLKTLVESFRDWGRDCWCPSGVDNTCGKRFGWQLGELPGGYDHKYIYSHLGYNLKPLDPQAAIGRIQLKRLPEFVQARKHNWELLRRGLADLEYIFEFSLPTHATAWQQPSESEGQTPVLTDSSTSRSSRYHWDGTGCRTDCSWFGFMLRVKEDAPFTVRDLAAHLDEHNIGNRMLFGGNLLRQPAFVQLRRDDPGALRIVNQDNSARKGLSDPRSKSGQETSLPGADQIMKSAIFLGTYPGLSEKQIGYMVAKIKEYVLARIR